MYIYKCISRLYFAINKRILKSYSKNKVTELLVDGLNRKKKKGKEKKHIKILHLI